MSRGHSFLECPRWFAGTLYASDFFTKEVLAWTDGEPRTVVDVPGQPAGLGWNPTGDLLVVSMLDRRLLRWDGESVTEVANLSDIAAWHCNDMLVDRVGRAYIGDFGWDEQTDPRIRSTSLHRVDPDGRITEAATDLVCPNGMAMTADGATLLVAETFAARISAFDVAADGELSHRRVWASFSDRTFVTLDDAFDSGAVLPDGVALDSEGGLWVADCVGHGVSRVLEGGEVTDNVSTGDMSAVAVTLGGPELRTLYICCSPPYPYTAGHPRDQRAATMRSIDVAVPGIAR